MRNRALYPLRAVPLALLLLLVLALDASANHSTTEWLSTGPNAANGAYDATPGVKSSRDGSHVFFVTAEPLVASDTDTASDVYERFDGTVTLVSDGTPGEPPPSPDYLRSMYVAAVSDDGSRVFIQTTESLSPSDVDGGKGDIYEHSGGTTQLVSTGPSSGPAPFGFYWAYFDGISRDGTRVFFETTERLVPSDTDTCNSGQGCTDVYERSGGTTTLLSTGPNDTNANYDAKFGGASADGTHVFFTTPLSLLADDTDYCPGLARPCADVYERFGGTTTRLSTGSIGGNGTGEVVFEDSTPDGARVYFSTIEKLESTDTDVNKADVYERSGGSTTLISTGPADTGSFPVCQGPGYSGGCSVQASDDGANVYFYTHEILVNGDTGYIDIYKRSGNTTEWVSQGPSGGNAPTNLPDGSPGWPLLTSLDGQHAFFSTKESLVPEDTDSNADVYERTGGATKLVSTGPVETGGSPDASLNAVSEDGSRALFQSESQMVTSDPDGGYPDVFERYAGMTFLISTGPAEDGTVYGYATGNTPDLSDIYFYTRDPLVSGDDDYCPAVNYGCIDLYIARLGYTEPRSASPLHFSLVPVFQQCGTGGNPADGAHSTPLATASCLPPQPNPGQAARVGPASTGTADLTVVPGNPATAADEADVAIDASLSDIQNLSGGGDYNPNPSGNDLTMTARLRVTDVANCSGASCTGPYVRNAGTITDLDFPVAIDCVDTPAPGVGASCDLSTSANAVQPGAIAETRQTVMQVFRVRVNDSGANGTRGDSDDRIFSTQGVYVP